MKRTLIVAAIAAVSATGAFAQSSVNIYGRLNLSVERQDEAGKTTTRLFNSASRLGFKGTEDLGGGLKVGFILESGVSPDTGAAGSPFWGRQSELNVGGGFGMVRLGNYISEAYFATADYISMHNHDTGSSEDKLYAYVGRNANKVAYRTPSLGGLTLEVATSLKETNASTPKNTTDFAANYAAGPLQLGFGYEKNDQANQYAVRGLYEMGPVILGAYYQRDKNGYGANFGNRSTYRVSAAFMAGASEFHANIGRAGDYSKVANSDASQYTLAYNYNLSKRTKVYAFYTKVDDDKKIYTGDFSSFAIGMRHNF